MKTQHAVDELIQNHRDKDLIKAKAILDFLPDFTPEETRRLLFELSRFEDTFQFSILGYCLFKHPEFTEQHPELVNVFYEKAREQPGLVLRKLVKIEPETAVFIRLAGDLPIREAIPRIRQFLTISSDQSVLIASLNTLGLVKDSQSIETISEFLLSKEKNLQSSAVKALGNMDSEKAQKLISSAIEKDPGLFEETVSYLEELDNDSVIHLLSHSLRSLDSKIRTNSKEYLIKKGAGTVSILVENLAESHSDLQIHTLNVLSEIGSPDAVKSIRKLLNNKPADVNVRFAAYEALANHPGLKGDYVLATGLSDSDDSIRLVAARAIENGLNSSMVSGIINMVKEESPESLRIIKAIIDAPTRELFVSLVDLPYFQKIAVEYIGVKVHREIREHYLALLEEKQLEKLAELIRHRAASLETSGETKPIICAVDDSVMILSVYRRVLNDLGFEPILFQYPGESLTWLKNNKPRVLFTDLNMPGMTGIELTRSVRELYGPSDLPIIMVTTQQEGKDEHELQKSGITEILSKPFDVVSIRTVLDQLDIRDN